MLRTTKTRVIGLALAGAAVLSGGIYATTALAIGGSSTETAPPTQQAPSSTAEWRAGMLDMLQDHMGLSGQAAEDFADEMTEHMQGFDKDFDLQEMVDWCNQYGGPGSDGTYGPGMMDEDSGYGGYGMMDEDSGYGGYGMMGGMMNRYYSHDEGWDMMGSAPATNSGSAGSNSAGRNSTGQTGGTPNSSAPSSSNPGTPSAPGASDDNYGTGGGGMMGGGMMQGPGSR